MKKHCKAMKIKHSSRVHRLSDNLSSFNDRLSYDNLDTQRQVSNNKIPYKYKRIERKLSNNGWTAHMMKQYKAIVNHQLTSVDKVQRYGIPKGLTYVVETYNIIKSYMNKYPNTKEAKNARRIEQEVEHTTNRFISKVERYGLRVKSDEYSHVAHDKVNHTKSDVPKYNGERVHIKLEEVL